MNIENLNNASVVHCVLALRDKNYDTLRQMELQEIDVDTDWIDKQVRLYNENEKIFKENMKNINIVSIFINSSYEIVKTHKFIHSFKNEECILSSIEIFQYFKDYRIQDSIKYDLNHLFVYNVDLDNKIYTDIDSITTTNFLSSFSYIKDIVINPSLFIFHEINCVYIIYKENTKNIHNKTVKKKR